MPSSTILALAGYGAVALLMLIEDIVIPLPSEAIMPAAGFLSTRFGLSLWGVVAAGTLGSLVGGLPWYYIGTLLGREHPPRWLDRASGHLRVGRLAKAEAWFARHRGGAVLVARLLPGVRALIGIPAGIAHMPFVPFRAYSMLGTLLWTAGLAFIGRTAGSRLAHLTHLAPPLFWGTFGVIVIGGWVAHRRRIASRPAKP
jgi:membrane protein DedA with SNARE-associated domain